MASYEEQLAGSTDMTRAGMVSDRAKMLAGDSPSSDSSGNVVKQQLVQDQATDAVSGKWEDVWDAVHAAREACDQALEDDPKADPDKTFNSCMSDLIEVLTELRDGTAGNIFDEMGDDSDQSDSSDTND